MWCESVARLLPLPARGCVPIDKLPVRVRPPLSRNPSCPVTTEPLSMSLSMSGSWGERAMGLPEAEGETPTSRLPCPAAAAHPLPASVPSPSLHSQASPPRTHSLNKTHHCLAVSPPPPFYFITKPSHRPLARLHHLSQPKPKPNRPRRPNVDCPLATY